MHDGGMTPHIILPANRSFDSPLGVIPNRTAAEVKSCHESCEPQRYVSWVQVGTPETGDVFERKAIGLG